MATHHSIDQCYVIVIAFDSKLALLRAWAYVTGECYMLSGDCNSANSLEACNCRQTTVCYYGVSSSAMYMRRRKISWLASV